MFGLFNSAPVSDSQLGELRRAGGLWRGSITIGASAAVPLAIAGGRREPDTQAVQIARQVATRFAGWRPIIEQRSRRRRRAAAVDQHQRLVLVAADRPRSRPFQPACSISQPAASFSRPSGCG
jgi:hypothetical protein